MNSTHITLLSDPQTGGSFKLHTFSSQAPEIIDGLLVSGSSWYPVIAGIPRLLLGDLRHDFLQRHASFYQLYQKKLPRFVKKEWQELIFTGLSSNQDSSHQINTGSSFAYEWENIYRENDYERRNYLHFLSPFLTARNLLGKKIIDLGCGSGRFTKQAALLGARMVVGVDVGESVDTAYKLCRDQKNVLIVQADIYHLPFKKIFDIAHSIGVLHHLPHPKEGFLSCLKVLKKPGKMLIWVYNRRHNARAIYIYEPLRVITRLLPKSFLYSLCYIPAGFVHLINILTKDAKSPPFGYYRNFPFNMKLNDAFDVLSTPKSNYYKVEEILSWFRQAKLSKIRGYEHEEAGITCIGEHV